MAVRPNDLENEKVTDSKLLIGRMRGSPKIYTIVTNERIQLGIDLSDFITSVCNEIGNPSFILTKAQLEKRLQDASHLVIREIKKESERINTNGFRSRDL